MNGDFETDASRFLTPFLEANRDGFEFVHGFKRECKCGYHEIVHLKPSTMLLLNSIMGVTSLEEALERKLQRHQGGYCSICQSRDDLTVKAYAPPQDVPHSLVLKLDRLPDRDWKRTENISFPTIPIDFSRLFPGAKYQIHAVCQNLGEKSIMFDGRNTDDSHYNAIVKAGKDWWLVDDTKVQKLSESERKAQQAGYLYFLRKASS